MDQDERPTSNTAFARHLRYNRTVAERMLWDRLKGSKLGYKFTRQVPIDRFFADFCCRSLRLVVELDGAVHKDRGEEDANRDSGIRALGYEVLRFTNEEVYEHMTETLERIQRACEARPRLRY